MACMATQGRNRGLCGHMEKKMACAATFGRWEPASDPGLRAGIWSLCFGPMVAGPGPNNATKMVPGATKMVPGAPLGRGLGTYPGASVKRA